MKSRRKWGAQSPQALLSGPPGPTLADTSQPQRIACLQHPPPSPAASVPLHMKWGELQGECVQRRRLDWHSSTVPWQHCALLIPVGEEALCGSSPVFILRQSSHLAPSLVLTQRHLKWGWQWPRGYGLHALVNTTSLAMSSVESRAGGHPGQAFP